MTFLVSAATIFSLREIPKQRGKVSVPSILKQIWRAGSSSARPLSYAA